MRERRSQYHGPVEIFAGGEKRLDANASLSAYVVVVVIRTIGGTSFLDANTSWDGYIIGASHQSLLPLFGERLRIKFPNGLEAGAILESLDSGLLQGFGAVPFYQPRYKTAPRRQCKVVDLMRRASDTNYLII